MPWDGRYYSEILNINMFEFVLRKRQSKECVPLYYDGDWYSQTEIGFIYIHCIYIYVINLYKSVFTKETWWYLHIDSLV